MDTIGKTKGKHFWYTKKACWIYYEGVVCVNGGVLNSRGSL